jgi:Carboxypeptidase regulatory-like domain/TonB-dependent Receptor Plug Domain
MGRSSQAASLRAALCATVLLCWSSARAQINTATILGSVTDPGGVPLPQVAITATNAATGITRTTLTNNYGVFRFAVLPPGTYQVQTSTPGFRTELRQDIPLHVGEKLALDFSLSPGSVTEQVTVASPVPPVETTSAIVSSLVDPEQMRELPLNARSFIELVPLLPGAVFAEAGAQSATQGFATKLAIAGARYNTNSFLLDGADMNDATGSSGSSANTMAGVETLREFQVITGAYDAEFGRHSGGVVNAVTQSGGNHLHGSLFEYLRNDSLDAARWEDNALLGGTKPEYRRNQFGGSLGGPVVRTRMFFFGSFEGLREAVGQTAAYTVPGPEMRAGNFITTAFANGQVVRGSTTFLGIAPAVKPFLDAYPQANAPCRVDCFSGNSFWSADGTGLLVKQNQQITGQNFWTARLDDQINSANTLFARITVDRASRTTPAFDTAEISATRSYYATVEAAHNYSPELVGRTHFSFVRTNLSLFDRRLDALGLAGYGLPVFNFSGSDVPGILNIGGLTGWGGADTNPKLHIQNTFELKEDFYWSAGRHAIKAGAQWERFQFNQRSDLYASGEFSFAGFDSFLQDAVDSADFVPPGADNIRGWRQNLLGIYLQDNVSLRPGLALNLGVRYEMISVPREVNGKVATIRDLRPQHLYSVLPSQTDVGDPYFLNPSLRNFAPRIGFAWTPSAARTFSVRGGLGIFHEQLLPDYYITSGVRMEPFYTVAELFEQDFAPQGIQINFPNAYTAQRNLLTSGGGKPQADGLQFHVSQPTVMKGSLSLQQQVAGNATVEAGYSFSRGLHLVRGNILLNTTPLQVVNGNAFIMVSQPLPNPNWNRMLWRLTDGTSWYHALLLSMHLKVRGGLEVETAYTLSKSLDDGSNWNVSGDYGVADTGGVRAAKWWGRSAFDIHNSFSSNFILPLGARAQTGAWAKLLGGWSLSGLIHLNSGYPMTPSSTRPRTGTATVEYVNGSSLNLVPGGDSNPIDPQNPDHYFDAAQFAYPAHGVKQAKGIGSAPTFDPALVNLNGLGPAIAVGNLGRNTLTAPGSATIDLALRKRTPLAALGEAAALEFRAEAFNLFNRPNFDAPDANLFTAQGQPVSTAGAISGTRGSPRQLQVALRLEF